MKKSPRGLHCTFRDLCWGLLLVAVLSLLNTQFHQHASNPLHERELKDAAPISVPPYTYRPDESDSRPRNLRLVLMGDSVTRYQYIALAYFLKTGRWLTEDVFPNPLYLHHYGGWNPFFQATNNILQPEEQCDCYMQVRGNFSFGYSENRYFSDPERGNYVVYIGKFGFKPTRGHWRPDQAFNDTPDKVDVVSATQPNLIPFEWDFTSWNATIARHIARLTPKPEFLVFNAGLHRNDLKKPEVHFGIVEAAQAAGILPIYKTTTYPNTTMRGTAFASGSHDKLLCGTAVQHCLDLTWTSDLQGPHSYYDMHHYKPDVNTRMNLQMLAYLQAITAGGNATDLHGGAETESS